MSKKIIGVCLLLGSLFLSSPVFALEPWPGESWQESTNLTALDADFQRNLSGAHWNDVTKTLWVCLNGPGKFWALEENANGQMEIVRVGNQVAEWDAPGDLEGITQVNLDEDSIYVIAENENIIRKYDVSVFGAAVLQRSWNITAHVPAYNGSAGPEGIAFVPDEWLQLNGFVNGQGQPYVSRRGMGGLMFVAHQNGGGVYVFDLDPNSNNFDFVGLYRTSRAESSGLEFDRSNGKLYIWHNTGTNYIEITNLTSNVVNGQRYFITVKEYNSPKGGNLEGIALTPASSEDNWFFFTDDDNQNGAALMHFQDYLPELLGHDRFSTYQNTSLTVARPGLLTNDSGVEQLVLVQGPANGSLNSLRVGDVFDGSFVYQPAAGFTGVDSFTYSSVDRGEIAKVEITVKPVQTMTKTIASSSDDAEERSDGLMSLNSSDLELLTDALPQTVGLRFNSIALPANTRITNAYIQFTTDETVNQNTNLAIQGEASADASTFNATAFNVSRRARTSASVLWQPETWMILDESGPKQRTPNLAAIIEEIIHHPNWQSGNDISFIITGAGKRVARAYDFSSQLAPRLVIEYAQPENQPVEPMTASLDLRIASSMSDVEEQSNNGAINNTSTDLELNTDAVAQTVGLRFTQVSIPPGAEIISANIQFTVDEVSAVATDLNIYCENTANPAAFSANAYDVSRRSHTVTSVRWQPLAWNIIGEAGLNQKTPELQALVQQMIDHPNWQSGNSLVFIMEGSGKRVAESYDGSPAMAPLLHIEYRL